MRPFHHLPRRFGHAGGPPSGERWRVRIPEELVGETPWHTEGQRKAEWVLLDYVDVVVHIFHKSKRDFYGLEHLWSDAILNTYENVA